MAVNDPLGMVFPGDRSPNSARRENLLANAARRFQRSETGEAPPPGPLESLLSSASLVFVQAGAAGLDALTVSTYGTPAILPAADNATEVGRRPTFAAGVPAAASDEVCITVEAAPPGGFARAVCVGVASCKLLLTDATHTRAVPIAGDKTRLASAEVGGFPVLWKGAGIGEVFALVRLPGSDPLAGHGGDCRKALAGLIASDHITFEVFDGTGICANVLAKKIPGYRPDPAVEVYVSTGKFTTAKGLTSLRLEYAADDGDPVVFLVGPTVGSSVPAFEQPLTYVGCVPDASCGGDWAEFVGRPGSWCDATPVTTCSLLTDGAPRRYKITVAGGTGAYASLNGTFTAKYGSGCSWAVESNTGGTTGTTQWISEGPPYNVVFLTNLTYQNGATAALFAPNRTETSGCVTASGTLDVDWSGSDITPADGDVAPTWTVSPLGPCVAAKCDDNTFRVRVRCSCAKPADWCGTDGGFTGCFDVSKQALANAGYTGCTDGVRVESGTGPVTFGDGFGNYRTYCTIFGPSVGTNPVTGFGPLPCTGPPFVYRQWHIRYLPEGMGGIGEWVLYYFNPLVPGDYQAVTGVADPGPDADPWVLDFGAYGIKFTRGIECPPPVSDPPPDKKYKCVSGTCVEDATGTFTNDPTCGGTCPPSPPPPPGGCCNGPGEFLESHPALAEIFPDPVNGILESPVLGTPYSSPSSGGTKPAVTYTCDESGVWHATGISTIDGTPFDVTASNQTCDPTFGLAFAPFSGAFNIVTVFPA